MLDATVPDNAALAQRMDEARWQRKVGNPTIPVTLATEKATNVFLRAGDAVMLHCAAGMGRTGAAAACVLKQLGLPEDEALQRIRDAGSNPENAVQSGLVNWF